MLAANYQKYQQNSVLTASPQELTLMLYNGAIKSCNQGLEAIEEGKVEKAHQYITKTQDIILELKCTLDDKYPISKNFEELYDYIMMLLVDANITKNGEKLLEAKAFITDFRDLWKEAMKASKSS